MDINLTTPIAATVSLIQPWYSPLINAGAGIFGVIIGGILSLMGINRIRKDEARRIKREELKKIYVELIPAIEKICTGNVDENYEDYGDNLVRSLTEASILDEDISRLVSEIWEEYSGKLTDPQKRMEMNYRMYREVRPLMTKRLHELE